MKTLLSIKMKKKQPTLSEQFQIQMSIRIKRSIQYHDKLDNALCSGKRQADLIYLILYFITVVVFTPIALH